MFWRVSAGSRGEVVRQDWVRVVALDLTEGKALAPHAAPEDALLVCVGGTIEFVLEGEARVLEAGDGVAMRKGQEHALTAGPGGRALLLLRRPEGGA